MVHLSHTIRTQSFRTAALLLFFLILHVGFSLALRFKGREKHECAVLLPGNNVAAIPDDATERAMSIHANF